MLVSAGQRFATPLAPDTRPASVLIGYIWRRGRRIVHQAGPVQRVAHQVSEGRQHKLRPLSGTDQLAVGIVVAAVLTITYFTLFPFDFVRHGQSPSDVVKNFSLTTGPLWKPREVPINTVLFMPFGFGLAGLARACGLSRRWSVVAGAALGMLLSTTVELLQSAWL